MCGTAEGHKKYSVQFMSVGQESHTKPDNDVRSLSQSTMAV
jgi:hypothetical protein